MSEESDSKLHADIRRIAGPLVVSNISIALLGLVDTAVVGHLPHAYFLGGVALATVIFDFLYWGMAFLRMGTTGVTAQAAGAEDGSRLRVIMVHGLVTAVLLAMLIVLCREPLVEFTLNLLHGSAEVDSQARRYFLIAVWGAPAVLALQVCMGWLIGVQAARAALAVALVYNSVNVILDLVFVLGLGMDVDGVALAAVIAQFTGALMALGLVARQLKKYPGSYERERLLDIQAWFRLMRLNLDILLRTWCLIFVFTFFTDRSAAQGETILAANSILQKYQMLMALALDGFANAAEALTGRAIGAADSAGFRRMVLLCARWSLALAVAFSLIYAFAGRLMAAALTDIPSVLEAVILYLPWMILSPLVSVWPFLFDGVFIGATRGAVMRNTMAISAFVVFLPVWWLLQGWGNHGLWAAMMFFMVARGGLLAWSYYRINHREGFVSGA